MNTGKALQHVGLGVKGIHTVVWRCEEHPGKNVELRPRHFSPMRLRSSTLNGFAYALVTAALLFSLYCGFRASFPSSGNSGSDVQGSRILLTRQGTAVKVEADPPVEVVQSPCPKVAVPQRHRIISSSVIVHNPRRYHVLTTCQGFSNHWQVRIHYYW